MILTSIPATSLLILSIALAPLAVASLPLARDEGEFLQKPVDFSPREEHALDQKWLHAPEEAYPFPKAALQKERGITTLNIGGETMPTWMHAVGPTGLPGGPVERQLREAGVRLFIIDVGLTSDYSEERTLANAPDAAFAQFQRRAESVLSAVPDARIIVRFWMTNVGPDFVDKHPGALLQGEDGASDWGFAYPPGSKHHARPNMLNEWRRYCGEHLYRFIHRLGNSEFAPKVGGFYLGAMNSGEWWYYKGKGDPGWDYSPTRQAAFEHFAKEKYGGDRAAIARAWGRPDDERLFALPTLQERQRRPLLPNTPSMDYLQVLNQPVTNAARYFAQVIRAATSGGSLIGMEIHVGGVTYPSNGTVFMNHLLDAPEIDFFGGPSDYHYRRPGSSPFYRAAISSLEAHGKLWFNEGDYRTHRAFDTVSGGAGEPPMEPRAMEEVLKREFARGAVFDYSTYLMDFGWAWFYEPAFLRSMGKLMQAEAFVRTQGRLRQADIAFVTDQESQLYGNYFTNPTTLMLKGKLDQTGLSWDLLELRDLLEGERSKRYRMIVFLNSCALSDAERRAIEKLKGDGRLLLWMHNPGVVDLSRTGTSEAGLASALTGLSMKTGTRPGAITLLPEAFRSIGIARLPSASIGSDEAVHEARLNREVSLSDTSAGVPMGNVPSRLYSIDPEATVLGADAAGRAFFAMRKFPEWTTVYTAFGEVEPWVIRELARLAGCHVWSEEDDVVFAAGNLIGLHASSSGEKTIRLPGESGVLDIFTGEVVSTASREINVSLRRGETRFYLLGDAGAAREAWLRNEQEHIVAQASFKAANRAPRVAERHFHYHLPRPPELEEGRLELMGVHRFQAPALLVSGPYPSGRGPIAELDRSIAAAPTVSSWGEPPFREEQFGRMADNFLHVSKPQEEQPPSGPLAWYALANRGSWVNDYELGMSTGQSYVVGWQLAAKEKAEVLLSVAVRGEAALWVGGVPIPPDAQGHFEATTSLGATPTQVFLRVQGDHEPTGFTLKVAGAQRGRDVYSIPGSGVGSVAPNQEALTSPPEEVLLLLPKKRAMPPGDNGKLY